MGQVCPAERLGNLTNELPARAVSSRIAALLRPAAGLSKLPRGGFAISLGL
jgi:hypothetical protein